MVDNRFFERLLLLNLFTSAHCMITQMALSMVFSYIFSSSIFVFSFFSGLYLMSMGIGSLLVERLNFNTERYVSLIFLNSILGIFLANPCVFGIIILNEYTYHLLRRLGLDFSFIIFPLGMVLTCLTGIVSGAGLPIFSKLVEVEGWHTSKPMIGVLTNDYIGAFFGIILFTFILNPFTGLINTILISQIFTLVYIDFIYFSNNKRKGKNKIFTFLIMLNIYILITYFLKTPLANFIDMGCKF